MTYLIEITKFRKRQGKKKKLRKKAIQSQHLHPLAVLYSLGHTMISRLYLELFKPICFEGLWIAVLSSLHARPQLHTVELGFSGLRIRL